MLNDITFGQYYPITSFVHNMDARAKILLSIAMIVAIFLADNFYGLLLVTCFTLFMILVAKLPLFRVLRSLKMILFITIFMTIFTVLFGSKNDAVIAKWWIFVITYQGIVNALFLVLRLILLVVATSVLTLTTTPVALTDAIESLLTPLKWIKFPVHAFAMIMSIALRMIPTLIEETNKIIAAQKARGANFEKGGLIQKAKAMIPVLVPLLVNAFHRSEELANAMDARCYSGSKKRTKYKKLVFTYRDILAVVFVAGLITGIVLLNKPQFANMEILRQILHLFKVQVSW